MTRRMIPRLLGATALMCLLPGWASAQPSSANYKMPISLMNAGVGDMASPSFKLASSLGDGYFTGPSTSPGFKMTHGLWISIGGSAAAALMSAVSRKVHGIVGPFDLLLFAAPPSPPTQPQQGPGKPVVFKFDKPITSGTAGIDEGTAVASPPPP